MKTIWYHYLLWPNLWVGIFAMLAVAGIACLLLGYREIGLWLLAPLFVGGIVVVFAVIPIMIRSNRKHKKA